MGFVIYVVVLVDMGLCYICGCVGGYGIVLYMWLCWLIWDCVIYVVVWVDMGFVIYVVVWVDMGYVGLYGTWDCIIYCMTLNRRQNWIVHYKNGWRVHVYSVCLMTHILSHDNT